MTHELLRFSTAGSVDDGKSTLIGRLLLDTKAVFEDQLHAVKKSAERRGREGLDLALLTDGLEAEREQGITIDVAYRYFATPKRKFIIADTPGHEQYTRNMVTGASTADAALILVDAAKGLAVQSRRHAIISRLLGIRHVVVCVNKMDLAGFSEETFRRIETEFRALATPLKILETKFIPISALNGDNVVRGSENMPWYEGPPLLEILETLSVEHASAEGGLRFPVQMVMRPNADFRGYAGAVYAGRVRPGQEVVVLPGLARTTVERVCLFDRDRAVAVPPESVVLTLADEIDVSRGDVIADPGDPPKAMTEFSADLCWFSEEPLQPRRRYWLKSGARTVRAVVAEITYRLDVNTLRREKADELRLNEIAQVRLKTLQPVVADAYAKNRLMGSLILIDETTNNTVAGGMVV